MKYILITTLAAIVTISILAIYLGQLKTPETNNPTPTPFPTQVSEPLQGNCIITGCSGEICATEEVATACVYQEEFACYETATCERQENGKCGWTSTEELVECVGGYL